MNMGETISELNKIIDDCKEKAAEVDLAFHSATCAYFNELLFVVTSNQPTLETAAMAYERLLELAIKYQEFVTWVHQIKEVKLLRFTPEQAKAFKAALQAAWEQNPNPFQPIRLETRQRPDYEGDRDDCWQDPDALRPEQYEE